MRAIKAAQIAFILCALASPAFAAWSETEKTTAQNSSSSSLASATISIAQGHLAVVMGVVRESTTGVVSVSDPNVGNTYTVYSCQQGSADNYGFIAWSNLPTALSTQAITVSATGTVTGITFAVWDMSGQTSLSPEDITARACNSNSSTTISPTVTSGSPTYSNDLFVSVWAVGTTSASASFTTAGSWLPTNGYGTGNSNVVAISDYLASSGNGTQTNNPTTNSKAYAMPVMAFIESGASPPPQHQIMQSVP